LDEIASVTRRLRDCRKLRDFARLADSEIVFRPLRRLDARIVTAAKVMPSHYCMTAPAEMVAPILLAHPTGIQTKRKVPSGEMQPKSEWLRNPCIVIAQL
jgi:hypothetical protein